MPTHSTPHPTRDSRQRFFVALDVAEADAARRLVDRLGDTVRCYKIGLELMFAGGPTSGLELARSLVRDGRQLFLDMKLLDIPNTVEAATRNIAGLGHDYLTVHAADHKTLDAAVRGRQGSNLKLLAVTVMTSVTADDLREQGIAGRDTAEIVVERARRAHACGFDGVIASGHEAAAVRAATSPTFLIVTPGIRLAGDPAGDQARVMTPAAAIAAGASHLVIGRSITRAADPVAAARGCAAEIARAIGTVA